MDPPASRTGAPGDIQEQVLLPWSVAVRITLRGLKIRLGRSLITMSGVVLGIAFLMSVLTGEGLKNGLADETRMKTEVNRLLKLIEDEIGTFQDRRIGILVREDVVDRHMRRLLEELAARADRKALRLFRGEPDRWTPSDEALSAEVFSRPAFSRVTSLENAFEGTHAVLFLGQNLPPFETDDLLRHLETMSQPVILDYFPGRYEEKALRDRNEHVVYTRLSYQMTEEERQRLAERRSQDKARQIWITVVSILVTVIGISNAMLMSVTERIREIGTMKCLGALSRFVVKLFLIESFLIGVVGALVGTLVGFLVPFVAYMLNAGVRLLIASTPFATLMMCAFGSVAVGTVLAIVAAIYPAVVAAKMVPADALRTNV